jgi:acyl carrier protein
MSRLGKPEIDQVVAVLRAEPEVADATLACLPGTPPEDVVVVVPVGFLSGLDAHRLAMERLGPGAAPVAVATAPQLWREDDGELDQERLGSYLSRSASVYRYQPPGDDTERRLAAIWQGILAGPAPGVHDDFIEAGGDSMTAVQLIAAIAEEFGVELSLEDIFSCATVRQLGQRLRPGTAAPASGSSPRAEPAKAPSPN